MPNHESRVDASRLRVAPYYQVDPSTAEWICRLFLDVLIGFSLSDLENLGDDGTSLMVEAEG